jgi:glycosyltransferase involved in cell wall biosynthesis
MKSGEPLVSVVMIFLDGERFIDEAVRSVLSQTYRSWELLLIDDGSTDSSGEIAEGYAKRFPAKVRYLQHQGGMNRGMSASRNLGIREARGEYVSFLDADDLFLPDKLERQVAILESQPDTAMIYGPTLMWYSWGGEQRGRYRDMLRPLGMAPNTLVPPPRLLPLFLDRTAYTPGTCAVLVRREVAMAVGGFEEKFRGMYEDQVFFYKICYSAPVFVEGTCGDLYRQTVSSHSNRMRKTGFYRVYGPSPAYGRFLEWLEEYLTEQRCTEPEIWAALRRELRPYRSRLFYALFLALQPVEKLRRSLQQRMRPRPGFAPPPIL